MRFEWDENKNRDNRIKHGVSFEVAKLVFNDPYVLSQLDRETGYSEERWLTMGSVAELAVLLVVHTVREENDGEEIIRIISARKATARERVIYLRHHP
jgi:uncharacterized DUF497 family protein